MLTYNEANGAFVLFTKDPKRASAAGLTLSTKTRGPNGEKVFYTSQTQNRDKFDFNPYAVLEFWDEADEKVRSLLGSMRKDYQLSWKKETSYVAPHPPDKTPMDFQNAGVEYCLGRKNSIIGDEMGLGKTIQAILLANSLDAQRILVVCPASIRKQWKREIYEWSIMGQPWTQTIMKGSDGVSPEARWTVVSYDLLRNKGIFAALRATQFDLVVLDEAHYMKTPEAARTRAVFGGGEKHKDNYLALNAKRMVALTGTLLPNRPREAYTIARGFDWGAIDFLSYDNFLYRFNPSGQEVYLDPNTDEYKVKNYEERGRLAELNARLRCNLMTRRLAREVLTQLPDKRYEMTYLEPDGAIADVLAREALIEFNPYELFNPDFTMGETPISTLRREMGEAMVPRVIDYMKYMLDIVGAPKVVLFAHHKSVIQMLAEGLEKYGVAVHKGGMTNNAKERAKADFISGRVRIFLGQNDTMEGLDGLQSVCSVCVSAEPAWNPGRNEQCVGRLYRNGQHGNVLAHFLLVEGSFNEKVLTTVLSKAINIHASMDKVLV